MLVIQGADDRCNEPGASADQERFFMGGYRPSLDLWHTCAASLLGRGVHPKLVHHRLRHASITMTLDRYSQWIATMGRHAADGMDEALG